jgi:hypothetical protein
LVWTLTFFPQLFLHIILTSHIYHFFSTIILPMFLFNWHTYSLGSPPLESI